MSHFRKTSAYMCLVFVLLFSCMPIFAVDDPVLEREYPFSLGENLDSRNSALTGITLNKLGYDLFNRGISEHLPSWSIAWIEPAWSVFWTFNLTMWPHDYGHWARANQADGNFVIEKYRFPFPLARMDVPDDATYLQETLMAAGGFEINSLMRNYTERRFFQTGYRDAEDMVHSFIQTMLFPMYTILIAPTNPDKVSTWEDTYGDPVDIAKQVFENYSGRPSIRADNTVDPELVKLYREFFWVNIASILLDPMLYKSATAFAMDMRQRPRVTQPWLYQTNAFSWAYTTRFNPGALGYEVYLTQHIRALDHYFSFYARLGRPFKNRGVGVYLSELWRQGRFSLDTSADIWDQDLFGRGGMLVVSPQYRLSQHVQLSLDVHWKDDGYVIGHRLEKGVGVLLGTLFYW